MNQIYGFEGEVKAKYTAQMYELFSEVFEWLPLAQCINGKVLVRSLRTSHTMRATCWCGGGSQMELLPSQRHMLPLDHARRPLQRRWCHSG